MSSSPTPDHYQRRVGGVLLDPYRIARVYGLDDHALFSALKKILAAGKRGAKDTARDVQDAIDALVRWQEMGREDNADRPMTATEIKSRLTEFGGGYNAGKTMLLTTPGSELRPWPTAYCPGANGHTCDGGRLVECDEHGETDAGPCPRCNPPPPQTYRDRIAELERQRDELQQSLRRRRDGVAVLERERDNWRQSAEIARSDLDATRKTLAAEREAHEATRREMERRIKVGQDCLASANQLLAEIRDAAGVNSSNALPAAVSSMRRKLAEYEERSRPSRQSEKPAPEGVSSWTVRSPSSIVHMPAESCS